VTLTTGILVRATHRYLSLGPRLPSAGALVQRIQRWTSADGALTLDPVGGGGTSHVWVFNWIERAGANPACVICLTDLATEFPDQLPGSPVVWAVVGETRVTPPFGQVVSLAS
jgi:predicted metal-dependent peptidase